LLCDAHNYRGTAPLIYASIKTEAVRALLDLGADPTQISGFSGQPPSDEICEQARYRMAEANTDGSIQFRYRHLKWKGQTYNYLCIQGLPSYDWGNFVPEPSIKDLDIITVGKVLNAERQRYRKIVDNFEYYNPKEVCNYCNKEQETLKRCSRCKEVWFCNRMCQKAAWMVHKYDCKPVQE